MKIMVLGDSHGNIRFIYEAIQLAVRTECDVLHVVGDFGVWDHAPGGVEFLDLTNELSANSGVLVTFTDGNHENFDSLYSIPVDEDGWRRVRPNIWHAPRGHMWRWDGLNFLSMGGAHSIDGPGGIWRRERGPGKGWWPEETITDDEVQTAIETMIDWAHSPYPDVDVMFTHDCPSRIPLPLSPYPAGEANRDKLREVYDVAQPQLLIHGHYHLTHVTEDRSGACEGATVVGLAHDGSQSGQFCFIETNPFTFHPPQ